MSDNIDEVIAAPIFCHAQFKGDDFTAREIARTILAALRAHGMEVVSVKGRRETLPEPMEVWACLHHDIYLGASKYSRESALEYASDGEVYRATLTFKERLK